MASPQLILGTNILVHYARASALWEPVRNAYQPLTVEPRPIISIARPVNSARWPCNGSGEPRSWIESSSPFLTSSR